VRLGRWAGDRTWRERLVLILHVGYAFVPLGFLLNAMSAFELVRPRRHSCLMAGAGYHDLAVDDRATLGTPASSSTHPAPRRRSMPRLSSQPWRAFAR